ncbi:hypothetical protein ACRAWF_43530 [Streptomyces sp. L7]
MTRARELPDSLERLDGIGPSAAPLDVTGTDGMFDEAETWLRREGFPARPPPPPRAPPGSAPASKQAVRDHEPEHQIRLHAQLNNLRRLREARSDRAACRQPTRWSTAVTPRTSRCPTAPTPASAGSGCSSTATRDATQASTHNLVLPGIQVMGLAQMAGKATPSSGASRTAPRPDRWPASADRRDPGGPSGSGATHQYGHSGHPRRHRGRCHLARPVPHRHRPGRPRLRGAGEVGPRPVRGRRQPGRARRFGRNVNRTRGPRPCPGPRCGPGRTRCAAVAPAPPSSIRRRSPARCGWRYRTAVPRAASVIPAPPAARADGAPRRETAVDAPGSTGPTPTVSRAGTGADTGRRPDRHRARCRGHRVGLPAGRLRHPRNQAQPTPPAATGTGTGPILPVTAPAATGTAPAPAQPARDGISPLAGRGLSGQQDACRRDPAWPRSRRAAWSPTATNCSRTPMWSRD